MSAKPDLTDYCLKTANYQLKSELLQENKLKPHRRQYWVITPKQNAAYVAAMEEVLKVYVRPHDAAFPLVCLDESEVVRLGI